MAVAQEQTRYRPLTAAILVAAALVLSAPFVGQIRAAIRQAFPGHFVLIVGGIVAAGLCAALAAAALRIRDRRALRYGAILLALVVATVYSVGNAGENPDSNVVELFHFLQYGLIAFLFYRVWRPLSDLSIILLPALAGLIVGTVEEWLQWFIPNRVGELKDIFLNLVAIGCGLLFSLAVDPPVRRFTTFPAAARRRVASVAAAALIALAAFFDVVHIGHRLTDDEIGAFTSRFSMARLGDLQQDRTAAWARQPPPVKLVRLSREDQYLTEGIQHVRERNRLWAAADVRGAWLENRILEKYYEPVLSTPTHEGAGHKWSPEQRADANERGGVVASQAAYVSNAYPYRLYTWSRTLFWILTCTAAAMLVWYGRSATARTAD